MPRARWPPPWPSSRPPKTAALSSSCNEGKKGAGVKLGIDSYCYHRFFGEWYPDIQRDPGRRMTVWEFLQRAHELGVAGVSLDAHYLPRLDDACISRLRETLDEYRLEL